MRSIACAACNAEDDGPPTLRNDERLAEMMYLVVLTVCHSKTRQAPRLYRLPLPVAVLPVSLTHLPCIDSPNVAQCALSNGYTNSYQLSLTSSGYARHTRSPAIQVACSRRRTRRVLERRRGGACLPECIFSIHTYLTSLPHPQEDAECPLCLEEMDISDLNFKPCPCGYQVTFLPGSSFQPL